MRIISLIAAGISGAAFAGNFDVTDDIVTSETWTADNVYNLTSQIYVRPVPLTIQAGTKIVSTATANGSGALCVANGGQLFVNGDSKAPVVMTSNLDDGTWRASCNEWGNLTICGDVYIGFDGVTRWIPGNTLSAATTRPIWRVWSKGNNPTLNNYGGGDDNYDAGSISIFPSDGGRVVGLSNELNGLSPELWGGALRYTTWRS